MIADSKGGEMKVDESFLIAASVVYDAVYVAGGKGLMAEADAIRFVNEAYRHCKAIGAAGDGATFARELTFAGDGEKENDSFVILNGDTAAFVNAVAAHRNWDREKARKVPA